MAFTLNPDEKIIYSTEEHWSSYIPYIFWCICFGIIGFFFFYMSYEIFGSARLIRPPKAELYDVLASFVPLSIGLAPIFLKKWFGSKKKYVITNNRVHIKDGFFSKEWNLSKKDIVNIEMTQKLTQQIAGGSDVVIYIDSRFPVHATNIARGDKFREKLVETIL